MSKCLQCGKDTKSNTGIWYFDNFCNVECSKKYRIRVLEFNCITRELEKVQFESEES